jgi:hypothetical protein
LAVLALSASAIAFAQAQGKNEIAGTFGHNFISDQGVPNSGLSIRSLITVRAFPSKSITRASFAHMIGRTLP